MLPKPVSSNAMKQFKRIILTFIAIPVSIVLFYLSYLDGGNFEFELYGTVFLLSGFLYIFNFITHIKKIKSFLKSTKNEILHDEKIILGYNISNIITNQFLVTDIFCFIILNLLFIDLYNLFLIKEYLYSIILLIIFLFLILFFIKTYSKNKITIIAKNKITITIFILSWIISLATGFYYFDTYKSAVLLLYLLKPLFNYYYLILQMISIMLLIYIIQDCDLLAEESL